MAKRLTVRHEYNDYPSVSRAEIRHGRGGFEDWLSDESITIISTKDIDGCDREYVIEVPNEKGDFRILLGKRIQVAEESDKIGGFNDDEDAYAFLSWEVEVVE